MEMDERLSRLRDAAKTDWNGLCDVLDIKRTTLHLLRTNQREPTPKIAAALEAAEQRFSITQGINSVYLCPGWVDRLCGRIKDYARATEVLVNTRGKTLQVAIEPALIVFIEEEKERSGPYAMQRTKHLIAADRPIEKEGT